MVFHFENNLVILALSLETKQPYMIRYLLSLLLFACTAHALYAGTYPSSLDRCYTDRNKDLIADTPENPGEWIDPPVLVFSYAPHEDPDIYRKEWKDFLTYLSHITGKKVVYFPYQTNIAQLEAMRYGRLHISGFNTGLVPEAVNYAGFHPLVLMANRKGEYGYTMNIITYAGSGINTIEDLKGKQLTLTAPSSNSGDKAARFLLQKQFHLFPEKDYRIHYSGSHAKSIMGVTHHIYKVAAVASSVMKRMADRGEIEHGTLKILYRSPLFPTTAYGYRYNITPSLAKKIEKAFLTFPWKQEDGSPSSLKKAFQRHDRFLPFQYKKVWESVKAIQKASYPASGKQIRKQTP